MKSDDPFSFRYSDNLVKYIIKILLQKNTIDLKQACFEKKINISIITQQHSTSRYS